MKRIFFLLFALCACILLSSCAAPGGDTVTLIGADSTGKGAAGQLFGEYVAARVSELTDGTLTIDYHPNGALGGDADLLRQAQSGDIDIVVCQTAPVVSFVPEMAVFDLPMVFAPYDGDTIDKALNGADSPLRTALDAAYDRAGLRLLGILQNATYRLTTANVPLETLDDFAALQIRTMENSNHMRFWSAIGAQPTPFAWSEVYFSLASGAIDAQENAADTCLGANLHEVQKYLACTNHILYANQICISAEAYNALSPEHRSALAQAVTEATAYMRAQLAEIDAQSKAALIAGGMTLIEYDDAFYAEVAALDGVRALYDEINEKQINGLGTVLKDALDSAE